MQPALRWLTGEAFFGGANALWRTHVLAANRFRRDVQTEDIELSRRLLHQGVRLELCPEAISAELPPASLRALYRQRLRWAVGWDQVPPAPSRALPPLSALSLQLP